MSPARATPTALYIVAKGRSGSNILAHALGQLAGYVNTGELYHLWRWGLVDGALCGCGAPVPVCPLWSAVLDELDVEESPADIADLQDEVLAWTALPRMLGPGRGGRWRTAQAYAAIRDRLYDAIAAVTGGRVVVDASKWPWDPGLLGRLSTEVRAVHLVRDPRAVAFSWQREKNWGDRLEDPTPMPRFGAAYCALSWTARTATTELVRRLRSPVPWTDVRYENLVDQPESTLVRLAEHAGVPSRPEMAGARTVVMGPTHSIAGNVSKFSHGAVELRRDDEWRRSLARRDAVITTALTMPFASLYGYPIRTGEARRDR